jgi:hypothetical protein
MELRACVCNPGCPRETGSTFAPGHDAVYRERMCSMLRVKLLSIDEVRHLTVDLLQMPGLFRQIEENR